MRPVRPSPLAVACLHLGLAVSATAVFSQENAYIDAGSPRVWSFNEAEIHGPAGFSGMAKLYGTTVDGERHLLFETTVGYRKSLSATYYAWPDLVSVSFEGFDGDGAALAVSFRLPTWKSSQQAGDVDIDFGHGACRERWRLSGVNGQRRAFQAFHSGKEGCKPGAPVPVDGSGDGIRILAKAPALEHCHADFVRNSGGSFALV